MVERDVLLAELTGGRVHIAHLSTAASVDAVRRGKARGVRVTAEVTPHHLLLTDEAVQGVRIRHRDQDEPAAALGGGPAAVLDGLRDGTIDCIATDHAPHTVDDKKVEYDQAAFGIVGLETAVASASTAWCGPACSRSAAARGPPLHGAGARSSACPAARSRPARPPT